MKAKQAINTPLPANPQLELQGYVGLIDADYLIYRFSAANNRTEDLDEVLKNVEFRLEELEKAINCSFYMYFVSSKNNFRKAIDFQKLYKGNRIDTDKPVWFEEVYEWFEKSFPLIKVDGLEADDLMSYMHNDRTVIITADKDMLQVPGKHVVLLDHNHADRFEYKEMDYNQSFKLLIKQSLIGDATDNIPGIFGYGEGTFDKDFEGITEPNELINKAFEVYLSKFDHFTALDLFNNTYSAVRMLRHNAQYEKLRIKLSPIQRLRDRAINLFV